jgi:hypothetical protein
MKKIITLFIATLFSMQLVSAQKTDTSSLRSPHGLHDVYMQKHKTNNTVAWVCLGAGIGLTTAAIITSANNFKIYFGPPPPGYNKNKGLFLFVFGIATSLTSIAFFSASGKNKRKARLALKGENMSMGNRILNKFNYTAIAFTVSL